MYIERKLSKNLISAASEFPVIALVGPRQSGKTTLIQKTFPNHRYISLEDYDVRNLATTDPRRFLNEYPTKAGIARD